MTAYYFVSLLRFLGEPDTGEGNGGGILSRATEEIVKQLRCWVGHEKFLYIK